MAPTILTSDQINLRKLALVKKAQQRLYEQVLCRGFFGSVTITLDIQDGVIQSVVSGMTRRETNR